MIKEDPSKFATDLTDNAFSASMTALAVAPSPVTGRWFGDKASDVKDGITGGGKKLGSAPNPFD
ncbi:hypothetical protein EES43_16205 [Streptomyces sp. ADI96-02]|uniref:hypothetical protein n=1 Tax=Streptomyces sp. ADI96-02 TaxID=1522760 RepID=UPI000FB54EFE|nr:hypothetical protein [Streptomyces sp. ADI96-02]RPK61055.1 hypothetical protein EES43_16205 [Streptomyces sp. ADI96-02]